MEETPPLQLPEELYSGGGMFMKVMTDEQIEILQKQIAVYSIISQHLLLLHKSSLTSQNDHLTAGARMGNLYYDPYLPSGSHKMSGRQRWSPTSTQLQILEEIFNQGTGTPNKQKIKTIAAQLSEHGQISETNVYNWFQNRRARFKRKQQTAPAKHAQTEASTDLRSPSKTTTNSGDQQHHDIGSSTRSESMYTTDGSSELGAGLDQISFGASDLPNSRLDCLAAKIHVSDNSYPCWKEEGHHMSG